MADARIPRILWIMWLDGFADAPEVVKLGRAKYPPANRAASEPVIYLLNRINAPDLDADAQLVDPTQPETEGER